MAMTLQTTALREADAPGGRINRRAAVLAVAAQLFNARGFDATSMRDIALAADMKAGSLYHFFAGKDTLFAAVYAEGVRQIRAAVEATLETTDRRDPWARLQLACEAHLAALLAGTEFASVVVRTLPRAGTPLEDALRAQREGYEAIFRGLVEALPLAPRTDRQLFRLTLLGALNWSTTWYRPSGGRAPEDIARRVVGLLRSAHK